MTNLLIVAALALHMAKGWHACPRCGRPMQSITNLPCGVGNCRGAGGDPAKGQERRRGNQTTKGSGPSSAGGGGVQRTGFWESLGCSTVVIALASGAAGIVLAIGELVRALA